MDDPSEHDRTIFVVDDDADVRSGLADLLASVGFKSATFSSTREFLRSPAQDEGGCLILDVRLPGLSGLDLQAELSAANIRIPIIFISGYGDVPMTVRAMKAGAVEFLTKPFRDQDLLDAVRVALERDFVRRGQERKLRELEARFAVLSPREQKIMSLITTGLMNKQVAATIGVSEVTVKVHRHNLMKKMGARSLAELVRMADSLALDSATPPIAKPKYRSSNL